MHAATNHVVIAGAGVAGMETALALHALAGEAASVDLVAPDEEFVYRPLAVTAPFSAGEVVRLPLRALAEAAGATLRQGSLVAVAPDEKTIELADGQTLEFDALVLALGAVPHEAVPGALTFRGPEDGAALGDLLERATTGEIHRLVFVAPAGAGWPLPIYELALLTGDYLAERFTGGVEVAIATPEDRPLSLFGTEASAAVAELLATRGIALHTGAAATAFDGSAVRLAGDAAIEADAAVALPQLEGPRVAGIPHDGRGFVPTDEFGWVLGVRDVYAAGDMTQFPVKQGGIAAQQAEAVASAIAADVGHGRPVPFTPVLRGLLLTGMTSRFLRADTRGHSLVDSEPLWWPPAKIVGRHLTPLLAKHLGADHEFVHPPPGWGIPVEVELETLQHQSWAPV
jgi:sulfide:quinone oxidoreductase